MLRRWGWGDVTLQRLGGTDGKGKAVCAKMKCQDLSGQQGAPREGSKQEKAWIRFVLYQDHCQLGCGKAGAGAGERSSQGDPTRGRSRGGREVRRSL